MAQNSIGKAALILSANDGQLTSGLQKSESKIQGFKKRVSTGFGSFASGMKGAIAGVAAGGASAFSISGMLDKLKSLSDIGRQAKSIGVASDQFMGLSAAAKRAGIEQNEFGNMLAKMSGKIAGGSAEADAALSKLGLSTKALKGMAPDQQLLAIADGFSKTADAGDRSFIAMKLFEEAGLKLLPVLSQGGNKLRQFVAEQKKMGAALGQKDMDAVMKAQAARPKIAAAFDGMFNRLIVAFAPFLEKFFNGLSRIFDRLKSFMDWLGTDGVSGMMNLLAPVLGIVANFEDLEDLGITVFKSIGQAGAYAWDLIKAGTGGVSIAMSFLVDGFAEVTKGLASVVELGSKLPDQFGGQLFRDMAEGMKGFANGGNNTAEGMRTWGQRQIDGFGKSADDVGAWFDKLRMKRKEALNPDDVAADMQEIAQVIAKTQTPTAAMLMGSREDYSVRVRHEMGGKDKDQALALQKMQLGEAKQANVNLNKVADAIGKNKVGAF